MVSQVYKNNYLYPDFGVYSTKTEETLSLFALIEAFEEDYHLLEKESDRIKREFCRANNIALIILKERLIRSENLKRYITVMLRAAERIHLMADEEKKKYLLEKYFLSKSPHPRYE
jgi:hypothetical protein